jgi:DNA-binding NarL/FixJ family response regulator
MPVKVAITDDHRIVLNGLQKMLSGYSHIEITGAYTNGNALLKGIEQEQPDVVLLDIQMPDMDGLELTRILIRKYPSIRILVVSSCDVVFQVKQMLREGCMGYLLKDAEDDMLVRAIESVHEGRQFIDPTLKEQLLEDMMFTRKQSQARGNLTDREKQILQLIAEGLTNQEIATQLLLSLRTVENHRINMLQKLDVKNSAALVSKALKLGLIR